MSLCRWSFVLNFRGFFFGVYRVFTLLLPLSQIFVINTFSASKEIHKILSSDGKS